MSLQVKTSLERIYRVGFSEEKGLLKLSEVDPLFSRELTFF